ncbi:hypothetical protein R1flu_013318 [Riccia fluitans]|uniref:NB-ARC domain-containing protein n=1 Tax=Riccia fluitans TaxID=41844 RepID=A0ABD1YG33_9MARC
MASEHRQKRVGTARSRYLDSGQLTEISDHIYEVATLPEDISPSVELVFFHGLQIGEGDEHLFRTTWESKNGEELWPKWLKDPKHFPEARILILSYDAWAEKNCTEGRFDLYLLAENLLSSLLLEDVGQHGCPVILAGHASGCLVLKAVCERAHSEQSVEGHSPRGQKLLLFLESTRRMFYFSPASLGMKFADQLQRWVDSPGPMLELSTTLNDPAVRVCDFFRRLRVRYQWKALAVAETQLVDLAIPPKSAAITAQRPFPYHGVMVMEGSSRYDVDLYLPVAANHFEVSRLSDRKSLAFKFLASFVEEMLNHWQQFHDQDFWSNCTVPKTFGLDGALQDLENMLSQKAYATGYIGLAGMGGVGKTTLAKSFVTRICSGASKAFEYSCILKVDASVNHENLEGYLLAKMYRWGRKMPGTLKLDWSALLGKKVLILLDDVQNEDQILDANTGHSFGPGSFVMATSRNRSILVSAGYQIHDVKELSEECSKEFLDHAFSKSISKAIYEKHDWATALVKECGGLPLALEEVSKYLRSTDNLGLWDSTICQVKSANAIDGSINNKLWATLNGSYDVLDDLGKKIFVDLSTCFYGEEAEEAVAAWKVMYPDEGYITALWNLQNRSLVKCSGDFGPMCEHRWFGKGTRLMTNHKLLKYLGKKKKDAVDMHKYKQERVHVVDESTTKKLLDLKRHKDKGAIRSVLLMKIDYWHGDPIDVKFISSFYNLKVLWLTKLRHRFCCTLGLHGPHGR